MKKIKIKKKVLIVLAVVLILCSIASLITYLWCVSSDKKDTLITVITVLTTAAAAIPVFWQIKAGSDVSKAEFVMSLQETYTNTPGFTELFLQCWNNYKGDISNDEMNKYLNNDNMKKVIVDYLTFFESMYLMEEQGVLEIDTLDDLFGRRFFIVVNNKAIQDIELLKNKEYYQNVINLYEDWSEYRFRKIKKGSKNIKEKQLLMKGSEDREHKFLMLIFCDEQHTKSNRELVPKKEGNHNEK